MSNARVQIMVPGWWPPKVGDKLRMRDNGTEYLSHVVSTFQHDGNDHAVLAYYGKHRQRWHYEVVRGSDASYARIWPDGQTRPARTEIGK